MSQVKETSPEEIDMKVRNLDSYFSSLKTFDLKFRIVQLKNLKKAIGKYEDEILSSLKQELGKSEIEGLLAEITTVTSEINYVIRNLKKWMKAEKISPGILYFGSKSYVTRVPKGRVLIMSPWNYPINLVLIPLVSAISAGNVVMIKPSELVPNTSDVIRKIVEEAFDAGFVEVVTGGPDTAQHLLTYSWGHIMFTGSTRVGKIVYKAAAETFSPVTLELGGKSPTIVDGTTDLKLTSRRIVLGKYFNSGQTCVAPDYLLVNKLVSDIFIEELKETIKKFYSKAENSPDFGRLVNSRNFDRVSSLLEGQNIIVPTEEEANRDDRFIPPTIVIDPSMDSEIMHEEIFGPILLVKTYEDEHDLIRILEENPTPLAMYIFSKNNTFIQRLSMKFPSGDLGINSVIYHTGVAGLPFGGVATSGIGAYKGKYGFETFSQIKTIFKGSLRIDPPLMYPPYPKYLRKLIKFIFR